MKEKTGIAAFSEAFRQGKNCGKAVSNPQPIMTQKERKFKKKRNFPCSPRDFGGKTAKKERKTENANPPCPEKRRCRCNFHAIGTRCKLHSRGYPQFPQPGFPFLRIIPMKRCLFLMDEGNQTI